MGSGASDGNWHHYVFVNDARGRTFYRDGLNIANNATTNLFNITDFGLTDKRKRLITDEWINTLYKYHTEHYPFMKYTQDDIKAQPELLDFQIFEIFNIEPNDTKII